MRARSGWMLCVLLCAVAAQAQAGAAQPGRQTQKGTLTAFKSDSELRRFLRQLAKTTPKRDEGYLEDVMVTAAAPVSVSITNTQHDGVDEGGIVKRHGDYLVMLRRGRLFTVSIAAGELRPVASIDAFGPDASPESTWYDEMLIAADRIVVIGYNYSAGTELGLFRIDQRGGLTYDATYHLRSDDYYSSRNYASRLIGNKLIMYTPLTLHPGDDDPFQSFPALRKWHDGADDEEFERIVSARRVYKAGRRLRGDDDTQLHTVTICDLAAPRLKCEATSVIGPYGRVFYVSPHAVYVWITEWALRGKAPAMLYRIPLDGTAPSALGVSGSPVDQFSFLEADDGSLNVLVLSEGSGDGMWSAEFADGVPALLRLPPGSFGDGSRNASRSQYIPLPQPEGDGTFVNRFVGQNVFYGDGSGWFEPETKSTTLFAANWKSGAVNRLQLLHSTDRIEAMGSDAVVIGTDAANNLHFTGVRLAAQPSLQQHYRVDGASQGELRSHGFFYKPEDGASGILGLPIRRPGAPGYEHLFEESAAIVYLRNDGARFSELGQLQARDENATDDGCRASCVDWYGNSRPIFIRERAFALMGYEIVEGSWRGGALRETRRVTFAPRVLSDERQETAKEDGQ